MKVFGIVAVIMCAVMILYFGTGRIYTITKLADGRLQFDWGSRYRTRSGYDDRAWPKTTYEGLAIVQQRLLDEMADLRATEADKDN